MTKIGHWSDLFNTAGAIALLYSPEIFDHKKLVVRYGQSETYITQDYVYN